MMDLNQLNLQQPKKQNTLHAVLSRGCTASIVAIVAIIPQKAVNLTVVIHIRCTLDKTGCTVIVEHLYRASINSNFVLIPAQ